MSFSILQANNIKKEYHGRTVLDFEQLVIYDGDRIGVVGANGAGKSTLLGILMGDIVPDRGSVQQLYATTYLRQFDTYDETLSGGENQKRHIAQKMSYDQQIVFADEPTANLDEEGVRWVKERLESASAAVIISHDRALLDELCTQIIAIEDGQLTFYTGNYSDYEEAKELSAQQAVETRRQIEHKERQLRQAIEKKEQAVDRSNQRYKRERVKNSSEVILGKMRLAGNQKQMQREATVLKGRLDRLEDTPFIKDNPAMYLDFSLTDPPRNRQVIACEQLSFSYGNKKVLQNVTFYVEQGERIAITGKNGSGKTTLLNQIFEGNPAIHKAPKLKLGYLRQDFEQLDQEKTVLENVMSTSIQTETTVRNALAGLLFFGQDVFKKAQVLSGGEKIKLALAKLLMSNVNGLLLDEPTNFLDIPSMEALQNTLLEYPGIILLVSHDRRFRQEVATRELNVSQQQVQDMEQVIKAPVDTDRMLLEMRRTQLAVQLESASANDKEALEQEYQTISRQLAQSSR